MNSVLLCLTALSLDVELSQDNPALCQCSVCPASRLTAPPVCQDLPSDCASRQLSGPPFCPGLPSDCASRLSLQKELVESDLELARAELEKKVAVRSLQEQRNFFDFLHFSPLKVSSTEYWPPDIIINFNVSI